mgnify:FL=1
MIADREPQVISILQGGSHKLYSWCIVSLVFAVLYSNPVFREVRETQYFTAGRTLGFCLTVAPLAGAWIETSGRERLRRDNKVAPLAGAWIETGKQHETHGSG